MKTIITMIMMMMMMMMITTIIIIDVYISWEPCKQSGSAGKRKTSVMT
jgi:hypothetical protein